MAYIVSRRQYRHFCDLPIISNSALRHCNFGKSQDVGWIDLATFTYCDDHRIAKTPMQFISHWLGGVRILAKNPRYCRTPKTICLGMTRSIFVRFNLLMSCSDWSHSLVVRRLVKTAYMLVERRRANTPTTSTANQLVWRHHPVHQIPKWGIT